VATSLPPGAAPEGTQGGVDIRYYGDLLWRGRNLIALAAVLGLALGLLVGFAQTPEYRASTMLQIEPPTPTFLTVQEALSGNYWQNADFYNTQFKVLKSGTLGGKVLDRLKIGDRPPFKDSPAPGVVFMGYVGIEPVVESRLVLLHITHRDPKEAALWANTLADVYIEESLEGRVQAARKAYEWLQERLASTQKEMREAQDKLFRSYQTQDLFVPEGSVSAVTSSISKLTEDFIAAQARRISLEAALKQIASLRAAGQSLDAVPQFAADAGLSALNAQISLLNNEMARLKGQFREGHPEVQRVTLALDQAQKSKERQHAQIVAAIEAEYSQLQRRESELKTAIDAQKAQATSQSRKGAELEAVRKEAESSKSLYDVLLQKLNESDIAASIRSNNVSVVERATVPSSPIRPDKKKIASVGLVLGLMLGVGLVLGRDYFDNTLKHPDEVERYLHVDLLAAVPRYGEGDVHLVNEAYQNLRTALIFARRDERGQVVLVTGTIPQEGKTTTLVNLAKLLASSGEKTVALDFDLRRAQLHNRLDLTREPGLTNHFVQHEELDKLIRPTHVPNLFALTAGPLPPNPPALIARKAVPDMLDELRDHFAWVLIDSPPLASVTDALLLARYADIVVFVIQHNKVDKRLVKRHLTALRKTTPNLLGAVLNGVDVKAKGYYYYYYQEDDRQGPGKGKDQRKNKPASRKEPSGTAAAFTSTES
jgi:succinoglycan biosynthesis transport protein ExoP